MTEKMTEYDDMSSTEVVKKLLAAEPETRTILIIGVPSVGEYPSELFITIEEHYEKFGKIVKWLVPLKAEKAYAGYSMVRYRKPISAINAFVYGNDFQVDKDHTLELLLLSDERSHQILTKWSLLRYVHPGLSVRNDCSPEQPSTSGNKIIIDGAPIVGHDRIKRFKREMYGLFATFGSIVEDFHPEDEDGGSKGYFTIEYSSPVHADEAVRHANNYQLDARHTLHVNIFTTSMFRDIQEKWISSKMDANPGLLDSDEPSVQNTHRGPIAGTVCSPNTSMENKNKIIVDGAPIVGHDLVNKLKDEMNDLFAIFGSIVKAFHPEDEDGGSKGYFTIEYSSPDHARDAVLIVNDYQLDEHHTLHVNIFTTSMFRKIERKWNSSKMESNCGLFDSVEPSVQNPQREPIAGTVCPPKKTVETKDKIIVNGAPIVGTDHIKELTDEMNDLFAKFGSIVKEVHPEDEDGGSKGYFTIQYASPRHADEAVRHANNHQLDAGHILHVNLFTAAKLKKIKKHQKSKSTNMESRSGQSSESGPVVATKRERSA